MGRSFKECKMLTSALSWSKIRKRACAWGKSRMIVMRCSIGLCSNRHISSRPMPPTWIEAKRAVHNVRLRRPVSQAQSIILWVQKSGHHQCQKNYLLPWGANHRPPTHPWGMKIARIRSHLAAEKGRWSQAVRKVHSRMPQKTSRLSVMKGKERRYLRKTLIRRAVCFH